ncbi:MAG TPA: glycosyltransferase [Rugosimonospora sp.]|nr:glycosyltransferase [Rugosimonospora sp.]
MTRISVFTPSHSSRWLNACYESLLAQTHTDWEWVVYLNNGAEWPQHLPKPWPTGTTGHPGPGYDRDKPDRVYDARINVVRACPDMEPNPHFYPIPNARGVGEAKSIAVAHCAGDILVELDHDDLLHPDALAEVAAAFEAHPAAGMVYSQYAAIDADGQPIFTPFAAGNGWRYRQTADGRTHPLAMPPTPHNVSHIWWAPNHLRAVTRVAYDKAGGYDPARDILDDQDLMARLYQVGEFVPIDRCLYLQRSHDGNTQADPALNPRIQTETLDLYDRHIEGNALAWAYREGLLALDLGGCHGKPDGYIGVDQHPGADMRHTFPAPLDLPDSSVGVIRAVDFLEHVADKVAMLNEIHRLLAPGGMLLSMTPSTDGRGAWQDPTHVSGWNQNSWWYVTDPAYARYVPELTARFQASRVYTGYPSEWHRDHDISYVTANLIAVKPGMPRNGGPLNWEV